MSRVVIGCRVAVPRSHWSAVPTPLFDNISQLLRDSFSVSQQPSIWEPPSHSSMKYTVQHRDKLEKNASEIDKSIKSPDLDIYLPPASLNPFFLHISNLRSDKCLIFHFWNSYSSPDHCRDFMVSASPSKTYFVIIFCGHLLG